MILDGSAGVREGDVIAGKYRVEGLLGAGGMGFVVAAHHVQLNERVAIKLLAPAALAHAESVARFMREARAAVKIKNEHVVRVSDVGLLPSGAPYIVMEYLEGLDLAAWISERGALRVEQAVDFVLQACLAVADAHALGIIHRDLKPANLFCVKRSDGKQSIKVLDFGISKMTDVDTQSNAMTRTSSLLGSPCYMSPEQMRSAKDVDARTDIWALGVILFELLAGRPPFFGESVTEVAVKIASDPAPSVRESRPDVPAGLEAVIFRALEKERNRRYRNVADLAVALSPFAPGVDATVQRISGILDVAGLSTTAMAAPAARAVEGARSSGGALPALGRTTTGGGAGKRAGIVGAIGLLALGGILIGFQLRSAPRDVAPNAAVEPPHIAVSAAKASTLTPIVSTPPDDAAAPASAGPPVKSTSEASAASSLSPAAAPTKALPLGRPAPAASLAVPTPAPPQQAPARSQPNCTPPYSLDARGYRMYKVECL